MHPRQVIRGAIRDALLHQTPAQHRVFAARAIPLMETELPCILVYTADESVSEFVSAPRELQRQLSVLVEAVVRDADADSVLDDLCEAIEDAMNIDNSFGDRVADSILTATELTVNREGDQLIGSAILHYTVTYFTAAYAQPTLTDFEALAVNVAAKVGNTTANEHGRITLPNTDNN